MIHLHVLVLHAGKKSREKLQQKVFKAGTTSTNPKQQNTYKKLALAPKKKQEKLYTRRRDGRQVKLTPYVTKMQFTFNVTFCEQFSN